MEKWENKKERGGGGGGGKLSVKSIETCEHNLVIPRSSRSVRKTLSSGRYLLEKRHVNYHEGLMPRPPWTASLR